MIIQLTPSRFRACILWLSVAVVFPAVSADEAAQNKSKFDLSDQAQSVLVPLFSNISKADVSRAKVELSIETVMNGEVVSTEASTFQIASRYPNQYTVYHKGENERLRIFADGEVGTVAISPQAYFELANVGDCQSLVDSTPVTLGPYPEPMLALTLAGVDPAITFLSGMDSVEVVGRTMFRGTTDSIYIRGQQDDGVKWDLWLANTADRRPLRLLVNLTPMLIATGQVRVPQGYELSLRYDFVSWRISGEVDDGLFKFTPAKDAVKYASMAAYEKVSQEKLADHPLLGKKAPIDKLKMLDGSTVESDDLEGKIVVLDFWATWCTPCMQAMPVIAKSVKSFADRDVRFFAVNVGENADLVKGFAGEQDWGVDIAVDPAGNMIDGFSAGKIPLTLIIAGNGTVEAAHVGYPGPDELSKQFKDELEVLVQGGKIASSSQPK